MAEHNDLGKQGEDWAVDYLSKAGYEILERNWMYQKAEIDIIAKKEDVLVVVEVKTRSSADFGDPQDFVNSKKIKQLVKAANEYLIQNEVDGNVRFDIVAVKKEGKSFVTEHLQDAFYFF